MIASKELSRQQKSSRSGFWWVVLLSAVAFTAALWASWQRPVWHDELYTLWLARMPLPDLLAALKVDSGPPLHYLLCHLLFLMVGWEEGSALGTFIVRLPSVVAFALLPWVVWWGTRQIPAARFWGPVLVVAWLPMLYFATEARAYAVLALVNALIWLLGPSWVERWGRWTVGFTALASCLPLLHYTGLVSLVMLPGLAFFVDRRSRRRLFLAVAVATLPILLWSPVMLSAPPQSMAWVDTTAGPGRPGFSTLAVLAPAGPYPDLFELASAPVPAWASLLILAGVIGCAVAGGLRRRQCGHDMNGERRLVAQLGIGLIPAMALGSFALLGIPVYFAGRTESMVWGLAAAVVVILVSGLPPMVRWIGTGLYIALGAATIGLWLADLPNRMPAAGVEVGRQLVPMIEDGDRVVVVGPWQLEVEHGLAQARLESGNRNTTPSAVQSLPKSQSEHPGWFDRTAAVSQVLVDEAGLLEHEARQQGGRIWLVWSPALQLERTLFPAFAGWQTSRALYSPILTVDLLSPPDPCVGTADAKQESATP